MNLTRMIKQKGLEVGHTHVGVTTADDFAEYEAELLTRPDYEAEYYQDVVRPFIPQWGKKHVT